jgi:transcriptional regulator with XRE-family HTH domain
MGDMAREPEAIAEQRRGLGERLATFRRAAGLTQAKLADAVAYDRSTLAHIERGQGRADERFWRAADDACRANGDLLAAFHEFEATKAEHDQEARQRVLVEARAKADWFRGRSAPTALSAGHPQPSSGAVSDPNANLGDLRRAVLGRQFDIESGTPPLSDRAAYAATLEAHRLYQLANYDGAARLLPALLSQLDSSAAVQRTAENAEQRVRTTAAAYIAAAKLATKQADAGLAWVTADRALRLATDSGHAGLIGAALYQVACALQRAGHEKDAEQVATDAAEDAARATGQWPQSNQAAEVLSVRGALLLLAAILAARRGDSGNALRHLQAARTLAELLTADGNYLWTAFGPTNVAIHEVAVHVDLGDTNRAMQVGAGIDTNLLPKVLNGRRSQVHVDMARAATRQGDDRLAVLHLLEGERVAAQTISRNAAARSLIGELLARERKGATPGLRALASRAEVLR